MDLLNKVAPVCFKYTVQQGQNEGTSRKLKIHIIEHTLEDKVKTIKSGNSKKSFLQTEQQVYDYWDKRHKKSWFLEDQEKKDLEIRITSYKRSQLLYNADSKIELVKKLLPTLKGKTILFGNSLNALLKITPNVINSKYSDERNKKIRNDFDNNKINVIGSFKKLKQGANLNDLDNCVIMSYYSSEKDFIQRIGRLRDNGQIGNVYIIVTKNTQEEIWFSKMIENFEI